MGKWVSCEQLQNGRLSTGGCSGAVHLHTLSFNCWTFTKQPSPNLQPFTHRCECCLILSAIWWGPWGRKPHFCVHSESCVQESWAGQPKGDFSLPALPKSTHRHEMFVGQLYMNLKTHSSSSSSCPYSTYSSHDIFRKDVTQTTPLWLVFSSASNSFVQVYTRSGTLAKLTYAVSETPAHNKWRPQTLNRASTEQEGLGKNN